MVPIYHKSVAPLAGWTDLIGGVMRTGIQVRLSEINNYLTNKSDTDEPHRLEGDLRRRHNCVYMGANLGDLGRWRDGPCKWIRSTVDCLCKKGDEKKNPPVFFPFDEEEEPVSVRVTTTTTTITPAPERTGRPKGRNGPLVTPKTPKKG